MKMLKKIKTDMWINVFMIICDELNGNIIDEDDVK